MSLAHLRADLDAHLAARPVQPCPVADMSPEQYAKWSHTLARWACRREVLENLAAGIEKTQPLDPNTLPACTPRADYHYRGQMPRKRKAA